MPVLPGETPLVDRLRRESGLTPEQRRLELHADLARESYRVLVRAERALFAVSAVALAAALLLLVTVVVTFFG